MASEYFSTFQEFLCAINGHVMKDPVRAHTSGLVFERATIELWLATRGCVCPITNAHLDPGALEPDEELRSRYVYIRSKNTTAMTCQYD